MKIIKNLGLALLLIAGLSMQVAAQNYPATNVVSLAWDVSLSPGITNYTVYYGTLSRNYSQSVNVGTNLSCTINNLAGVTTYFFAVTAKDQWGLESDFSTEIAATTLRPRPLPPANLRKTSP